jgi:NTP pyrophosphatase (non-canonical NTP hydrolase)
MKNKNVGFSYEDYNEFTLSKWNVTDNDGSKLPRKERLKHANLGILDENGEIAKVFKKVVGYRKPFNATNLIEEIGDYLFYMVRVADEWGLTHELEFLDKFNEACNNKKVKSEAHLVATDYCIALTKATYLIASSGNMHEVGSNILGTVELLKRFALYAGTNIPNIALSNIAKLDNRHKGGYNPENLDTRDKDAEAAIIEGSSKE